MGFLCLEFLQSSPLMGLSVCLSLQLPPQREREREKEEEVLGGEEEMDE